jgi:flagellar basal body-associated protein FliL
MIGIILIVFIVWIAVGIWVYKDAKQRNENAILWFVIVVVAGLLGILLWFVFRPPIGGRKTTPHRICPNCGREIPFDANLCSYCGKKFESYL